VKNLSSQSALADLPSCTRSAGPSLIPGSRTSVGAVKPGESAGSKRVVLAALGGNLLIALAKFVAAWLSGSAAMLAEAVHSVADTANQGLLLVGMGLSAKRDPVRYPLGRARETYLWAFVVSLMLFLLGGVVALYEGVKKLMRPHDSHGSVMAAVVVLVISIAIELASFRVAAREFNRARGRRSIPAALFYGKDPTIPIVLLEDTAALAGLALAFAAVTVTWATGSVVADAIGSVLIGVLLCGVGLTLAYETHGLIIGEAATPEMRARALGVVTGTPGVEGVSQMLTLHIGPDTVLLALKVRFRRGASVEEVEQVTNVVEERVRAAVPEMQKIFIEADGDYDPKKDPLAALDGEGS
jgi:cation diffusion facilitator family transporter